MKPRTVKVFGGLQINYASQIMHDLILQLGRFSKTNRPILILGETGTGKEALARLVHKRSPRKDKPFIAINAAELSDKIAVSELFGHERGAFSGAVKSTKGIFRTAHGGTLFLDEVGDLPLTVQARLLRVLQVGEVRPVGGTTSKVVDVRIVAATNRDLYGMVSEGKFRQDLLARLAFHVVYVPRLDQRAEDVLLIAKQILKSMTPKAALSRSAQAALLIHDWPENVRELEKAVISAHANKTAERKTISGADLAPFLPLGIPPFASLAQAHQFRILRYLHQAPSDGVPRAKILTDLGIPDGSSMRAFSRLVEMNLVSSDRSDTTTYSLSPTLRSQLLSNVHEQQKWEQVVTTELPRIGQLVQGGSASPEQRLALMHLVTPKVLDAPELAGEE